MYLFNNLLFIFIFQFSIDDSAQVEVDADYRFAIEIPESSFSNYPTPIGSVQGDNNVKYKIGIGMFILLTIHPIPDDNLS